MKPQGLYLMMQKTKIDLLVDVLEMLVKVLTDTIGRTCKEGDHFHEFKQISAFRKVQGIFEMQS